MNVIIKTIKKIKNILFGNYEWIVDFTNDISEKDKKESKVTAALGYLCFIIPIVFHDDKQFARFHANQSLANLCLSTIGAVLLSFIPYIGIYLVIAQEVLCFGFMIRGILLALQGKALSIPLLGWITIIAYRYPEQA